MEKIFQIFQDLRFDISFADALLLMPRFAPTIKSLLMNKEKLLELAKIPLNENCSAMLLKKLPEKLGDPGKVRRPVNYLSKGLAEDIFVKVGNFHFPTDFVVVDFKADPRVPLILGRSFLRTSRALIDVYKGELVLRDGNEQITFHVNDTSKHPQKHKNESIKMVNDTCKDSFKKFTDEPTQVCPPPPKDVNDEKEKQEVKNLAEPTAKRQTRITPCLKNFKVTCKESIFHSKPPQVSSVFAITSTLPSIEPKDSLIMGDEHRSTFSTEEIIPIPRESEETSWHDNKNVLPSCDDFSSIEVTSDNSVTFSNPLFEFDVNFNNPLFDEELEDIECKDSYDSNLDESTFLVTPLSNSNKDKSLIPYTHVLPGFSHNPLPNPSSPSVALIVSLLSHTSAIPQLCGLFYNPSHPPTTTTYGYFSMSNTFQYPKGEMKAITTRSGVAYEGPSIPTNPSPKKVVERETEETTDKEQINFQVYHFKPHLRLLPFLILDPMSQRLWPKTTPIPEFDVPKSLPKTNIQISFST
ncbi:reverse transcriptase domain-containing protein [Tanacetum coccineum]